MQTLPPKTLLTSITRLPLIFLHAQQMSKTVLLYIWIDIVVSEK
jgi:hypothetical protein